MITLKNTAKRGFFVNFVRQSQMGEGKDKLPEKKHHVLNSVWDSYSDMVNSEVQIISAPSIERFLADIFSPGEFYVYVLNITDSTLSNHHEHILKMHGL